MNLAISNIAWGYNEDSVIYELMNEFNFKGIEIAPTRSFADNPYDVDSKDILYLKKSLNSIGLNVVAMQSILFGKPEMKLFESYDKRDNLLKYLKKAVDFAAILEARTIVFGSPKNRIMNNPRQDYQIAVDFFRDIGTYAVKKNIKICIEPNPIEYGTNFINTTIEALSLVKDVDSLGFGLHVDTGTIFVNDENIELLNEYAQYINHIHISEPFLELINKNRKKQHTKIAEILRNNCYNKWVSIEMRKLSQESNRAHIKETLKYISDIFGGESNE